MEVVGLVQRETKLQECCEVLNNNNYYDYSYCKKLQVIIRNIYKDICAVLILKILHFLCRGTNSQGGLLSFSD